MTYVGAYVKQGRMLKDTKIGSSCESREVGQDMILLYDLAQVNIIKAICSRVL
jgi:hypothetical protein